MVFVETLRLNNMFIKERAVTYFYMKLEPSITEPLPPREGGANDHFRAEKGTRGRDCKAV